MGFTSTIGPNEDAQRRLERVIKISKRQSGIQLPPSFIRWPIVGRRRSQTEVGQSPTPLAQMLRGGHGGEVRLKLYLTVTLLATDRPFDITRQIANRTWAEMLALAEPETKGARRITDAWRVQAVNATTAGL